MIAKYLSAFLVVQTACARLDSPAFLSRHRVHPANPIHRTSSFDGRRSTRLFYVQEPIPKKEPIDENAYEAAPIDGSNTQPTQDNEVWMQASRTLGSLFLHQQDAVRDAANYTSANEGESVGFPFHESTLSSYLLNLKRQEEVNREKSHENKLVEKMEADSEEVVVLNTEFQIDQVCF